MATHRYDPYLWVHLAGIATVPLWLAISTLGLAVGSPQWPGLELALLALLGVSPALLMQLGRPFYIYSLLALKLKPTALNDDQRRTLTLFQQWWVRGLAVAAPVPLVWLLLELYSRAVVASDITPFAPLGHFGGLAVAAGSFAMANLFLQVPVSVLAVMATSDKRFKRTTPYPLDEVKAKFTQVGIPLNRLLPEVLPPDGAVPMVEDIVDQALVLQNSDAVELEAADVETAVVAELVDAGLTDSELVNSELTDSELVDLETAQSPELGATAPATKMDEAQVWAEALQSSTESSEGFAHQAEVLAVDSTAREEHEGWNSDETAKHLPASVEVETESISDSEPTEVESEGPSAVEATEPTLPECAANDGALSENLAPELVLEGIAESAMTSLEADDNPEDDMAHLDGTEAPRDTIEGETLENAVEVEESPVTEVVETVEATVEAAENAVEADVIQDAAVTDVIETEVVETVEATVEVVAEVSASEPQAADNWDHSDEGWDQTAHDWEQDPNWETSADATKDRTVEVKVAVVRISDPS